MKSGYEVTLDAGKETNSEESSQDESEEESSEMILSGYDLTPAERDERIGGKARMKIFLRHLPLCRLVYLFHFSRSNTAKAVQRAA